MVRICGFHPQDPGSNPGVETIFFSGQFVNTVAVLAERLRRTLKARVRKSVGSIPTDCIHFFFVFIFSFPICIVFFSRLVPHTNPRIAQLAERETVDGYN